MDLLMVLGAKAFGMEAFKVFFIASIVLDIIVSIVVLIKAGFWGDFISIPIDVIELLVFLKMGVPILPVLITTLVTDLLLAIVMHKLLTWVDDYGDTQSYNSVFKIVCIIGDLIGLVLCFSLLR